MFMVLLPMSVFVVAIVRRTGSYRDVDGLSSSLNLNIIVYVQVKFADLKFTVIARSTG